MGYQFDAFLSHSSKDKPCIVPLAEKLRDSGLKVWLDAWHIGAGDDIPTKVAEGLQQSRHVVLCLSPQLQNSDWGHAEASAILMRDPLNLRRRLIPLLLQDYTLPDFFGRLKHLKYCDDADTAFHELVEACRAAADQEADAAQAEATQRTFATLKQLAANHPSVRETIERFRTDLQWTADRIAKLGELKALHDHLHDLQVMFYNQIAVAVDVAADIARKMLRTLGPRLNTLVTAIKKCREKQVLSTEEFEWIAPLEEAKVLFDGFLKGAAGAPLEEIKTILDSILQVQPAMINRTMVQLATDLNLQQFVEVMRTIHGALSKLSLVANILTDIAGEVTHLAELDGQLRHLIQKHNQWQNLHNLLYHLDPINAKPIQLAVLWKRIWRITAELLGTAPDAWTAVLREEGEKVNVALAQGDPSALIDHLKSFQAEAEEKFFDADSALLEHCQNLEKVGDSLTTLLQV